PPITTVRLTAGRRSSLSLPRAGKYVLGPDLNRSESRGALPTPPVLPPTIAHTSLLHCGISVLSLSAMGQFRRIDVLATLSPCPLGSESGHRVAHVSPA